MATIRMSTGAVAALAALIFSWQACAQTASKSPLNIIAAATQDEPSARTATQRKASRTKGARKTAAKTSGKYLRAAGTPSVRSAGKTSARRTAERRAIEAGQTATAATAAPQGTIMRGASSVSLIARLPWWRGERMQAIQYRSDAAEDQVVAAAEAWLATNGSQTAAADGNGARLASAEASHAQDAEAYASDAADTSQVDALDLAAAPPAPASPGFLPSLLAVLGGAFAAAASARFLFL